MSDKRRWLKVPFFLALFCFIVLHVKAADNKEAEVIFTHDLHSHLESFQTNYNGETVEMGGFARLKTVIDEKKTKNTDLLIVDAGDFSMGTVYQTIFKEQAVELRMLGMLGFDASTLGNHEFDYRTEGLLGMMQTARESKDPLPKMVLCNAELAGTPFEKLEMEPYVIVTKGDLKIAVLGVFGEDALICAPTCELKFRPAAEAAKEVVEQIQAKEDVDMIVCISHGGTSPNAKKSEDELLAKAVPEIDLIISGHSHTLLEEPIKTGDTYIVSAGEYGCRVGDISLKQKEDGRWELKNYELIPLTAEIEENIEVKEALAGFRSKIDSIYMNQFGYSMDQILTTNSWNFTLSDEIGNKLCEETLGNIIADSYVYAVKKIEGKNYEPVAAAVVPSGVIRDTLIKGDITAEDAFSIGSLGIGADGVPGYPLLSVYFTGKELMTSAEIDASVSPLMNTAELYWSGLWYKLNTNRMPLNKVTDTYLVDENGERVEIEKDKLYRVISDLYSAQMLGTVTDMSFGILSIVPKDAEGNPIDDFEQDIIKDGNEELKLWTAIAHYLNSFESIPEKYQAPEGRKVVSSSLNPAELFKNPNGTTLIVYAVILLVIIILVCVVRIIINRRRQGKKR